VLRTLRSFDDARRAPPRFTGVHELEQYLERPNAPVADDVSAALAGGPIDWKQTLPVATPSRLLSPGSRGAENGYSSHADGRGFVAVHTRMPGVTIEMIDWWFDWHPHDPLRYRIWFPQAHFDIAFEAAATPGSKPFRGTIHRPVEDVGIGRSRIRIEFIEPEEFGFPQGDPPGATIVCGFAGDDKRRVRHTRMCHFACEVDGGAELRSRFWIGTPMTLYAKSAAARPINKLLGTTPVRSRAVPKDAPKSLAHHCAQEYANLAAILPEIFERHA
jgi:hypothetical protein